MRRSLHASLLATALLCAAAPLAAQEVPGEHAPDSATVARMMEAMRPGPEHARLAAMAGTWDARVKFWPQPGAQPVEARATAVSRMVLGGRFLVTDGKSEDPAFPVELMVIRGFDRRSGKYTTVGYDTYGTYYVEAEGSWDEATRSMTESGESRDPSTGRTERYDFVTRVVSPDQYVHLTVFQMPDGSRFTAVETTYTRRK